MTETYIEKNQSQNKQESKGAHGLSLVSALVSDSRHPTHHTHSLTVNRINQQESDLNRVGYIVRDDRGMHREQSISITPNNNRKGHKGSPWVSALVSDSRHPHTNAHSLTHCQQNQPTETDLNRVGYIVRDDRDIHREQSISITSNNNRKGHKGSPWVSALVSDSRHPHTNAR